MAQPMTASAVGKFLDRNRLIVTADALAAALAASLPWSTSATSILAVMWFIAAVPSFDNTIVRRTILTAAGALPVALWVLAVIGISWADVPVADRVEGLKGFHKLLFIPLLMIHFRRSEHAGWVLKSFLASCGVLLVVSWSLLVFPNLPFVKETSTGVPVKDYISQSAMFSISIAIAIELSYLAWRKARTDIAAFWLAVAFVFLGNILFVVTSRTTLVVIPVLLLLFGFQRFGARGMLWLVLALIGVVAAVSLSSTYFRERIASIPQEFRAYVEQGAQTSVGERLAFWKKSVQAIRTAPLIGHGTGTTRELFRQLVRGTEGPESLVTTNPHNQTLAIAIELGLLGVCVLYAMWIAHLLLFRGAGTATWIGLAVVAQNIVGSLFNSHLFDFTHGWGYVIGVGVAGGAMLREIERRGGSNGPT